MGLVVGRQEVRAVGRGGRSVRVESPRASVSIPRVVRLRLRWAGRLHGPGVVRPRRPARRRPAARGRAGPARPARQPARRLPIPVLRPPGGRHPACGRPALAPGGPLGAGRGGPRSPVDPLSRPGTAPLHTVRAAAAAADAGPPRFRRAPPGAVPPASAAGRLVGATADARAVRALCRGRVLRIARPGDGSLRFAGPVPGLPRLARAAGRRGLGHRLGRGPGRPGRAHPPGARRSEPDPGRARGAHHAPDPGADRGADGSRPSPAA